MKYPIILASLLALSLTACGKKEEHVEAVVPAPEVVAPAPEAMPAPEMMPAPAPEATPAPAPEAAPAAPAASH